MLVPLGLLHAFVLAEFAIATTDIIFLAHTITLKSYKPFRQPWFIAALAWWLWLLVCSLPIPALGLHAAGLGTSFIMALVVIRLLIFTLALQSWLPTAAKFRAIAFTLIALSCLWIATQSWQQLLTGHNLFGNPRWGDGALTGPFRKPRAGDLFGHLIFVALPPIAIAILSRKTRSATIAATLLISLAAITAILIGQRMGTAFTALGAASTALLIPPLRRPIAIAAAAAIITLSATPLISPPTHAKLVGETTRNISHFAASPYGELYTRATTMGLQSPLTGWGYNAFRIRCTDSQFNAGIPALHLPPTQLSLAACNIHPHNFYLQSFEESGAPGLGLFTLFMLIALATLAAALRPTPTPLATAYFTGALTYIWPLASTDDFPTLYEPGWFFFILGLGLATAAIPHLRQTPHGAPQRP